MLVRLQLVATMHGKPAPLVHRMICITCESERCSAGHKFARRAHYNTKMQKSASHHCRYVNPAIRQTKPATHQPASQKSQPAASESREPIRFTTSYADLPVKLFHILKKRYCNPQVGNRRHRRIECWIILYLQRHCTCC